MIDSVWTIGRINLPSLKAKSFYYDILSQYNLYGDEDNLIGICSSDSENWIEMINTLDQVAFQDNDRGELAELYYWQGRAGLWAQRLSLLNTLHRSLLKPGLRITPQSLR
jgi:hypothetical protein